jgi:hypothetical protein
VAGGIPRGEMRKRSVFSAFAFEPMLEIVKRKKKFADF